MPLGIVSCNAACLRARTILRSRGEEEMFVDVDRSYDLCMMEARFTVDVLQLGGLANGRKAFRRRPSRRRRMRMDEPIP